MNHRENLERAHLSLSGMEWIDYVPSVSTITLEKMCVDLEISMPLARSLSSRNIFTSREAKHFLNPSLMHSHSPFDMKGMTEAITRIEQALQSREKIMVFGDNDADGIISTAILYDCLRRLLASVRFRLVNKIDDGYGCSPTCINEFKSANTTLVITTDHGSTDIEGAKALQEAGMDLIVLDHHRLGPQLPIAKALLNPHQEDCIYPFKGLSAAGVTYKLVCGLVETLEEKKYFKLKGLPTLEPSSYLDLVSVATVSDQMPLEGENRMLVKMGLDIINHPNTVSNLGLTALLNACRQQSPINTNHIRHQIAPKINALGRVGDPVRGVQLLVSDSTYKAAKIAQYCMAMNHKRREIEAQAYENAQIQMKEQEMHSAVMLFDADWHHGVLSIIASKAMRTTYKPVVVMSLSKDGLNQVYGSIRSPAGCNVLEVLKQCDSYLIRHGGHPQAAGLMLDLSNLEPFCELFKKVVSKIPLSEREKEAREANILHIDSWVTVSDFNSALVEEFSFLSPFGMSNPYPVIGIHNVQPRALNSIVDKHIGFDFECRDGEQIKAIALHRKGEWELEEERHYDIACVPQLHGFRNGNVPQLRVLDMKLLA